MDEAEAKLILSSYTLGREPTGDTKFDQAKRLAESSPGLMQWWQSQKRHDQQVQQKVREFAPPDDLRASLMASMEHNSALRLTRRRWMTVFAVAASLLLGFAIFDRFIIDRSDDYTGPLVQRAYQYSVDGPRLKFFNENTQKITDWLAEQGVDLPAVLPPKFLEQEGIGCRPLNWSDERVAIICVNADTIYHMYVAKEAEFPDVDAPENDIAFDHFDDGWTVSRWKSNGYLFVLTAQAPVDNVSTMLANYQP